MPRYAEPVEPLRDPHESLHHAIKRGLEIEMGGGALRALEAPLTTSLLSVCMHMSTWRTRARTVSTALLSKRQLQTQRLQREALGCILPKPLV